MKSNYARAARFRKLAQQIDEGEAHYIAPGGAIRQSDYLAIQELIHHSCGALAFDDRKDHYAARKHRVIVCLMFADICENP